MKPNKKLDEVLALLDDNKLCTKCKRYFDPTRRVNIVTRMHHGGCYHCTQDMCDYMQEILEMNNPYE
jgi:hypothetical protein